MKSKRIIITLVMAIALMLALAISSYAATITLYSGADNTSESTTHNGALTLTGNTEANETVTVYFTDDGRAWKAGETVSFTKDTTLYTIECTKISTAAEYNAATGGGNYIIMADMDFHYSNADGSGTRTNEGGPIDGKNCTTRVFMNGKKIRNGNQTMFKGDNQSWYLLGKGTLEGYWGGGISVGNVNSKTTKVVWFVGKDILIEKGDGSNRIGVVYGSITATDCEIHIYGKINLKINESKTPSIVSTDRTGSAYKMYLHDGCEVTLKSLVNVNYADSNAEVCSITIDGGTINLPSATGGLETITSGKPFNGSLIVNGGTFTAANADTISTFKSAIVSDKKAQDIDATSFKVVCKECEYEKTLAEFVDFATDFSVNLYCPNCGSSQDATTVEKIFTAKGYSLSPDGKAISAGYTVNHNSLAIYEEIMGATSYGIVIANADAFEGKTFFDESNKINTSKALQVSMDREYGVFDCSLHFDTTSNNSLKLIICAYVIGSDGSVGFVQHTTGESVAQGAIAGGSFRFVTLDIVVALQPTTTKED